MIPDPGESKPCARVARTGASDGTPYGVQERTYPCGHDEADPPLPDHDPRLAGDVLRVLLRGIRTTLRRASPPAPGDAQLGAVSLLHRFGSALNTHFHFHVVVLDGVFSEGDDGASPSTRRPISLQTTSSASSARCSAACSASSSVAGSSPRTPSRTCSPGRPAAAQPRRLGAHPWLGRLRQGAALTVLRKAALRAGAPAYRARLTRTTHGLRVVRRGRYPLGKLCTGQCDGPGFHESGL
jgi:hypothetical protein